MRTKKIVCFLSLLLLFSAFMHTEGASPTASVSFRGAGVTIYLTFPEEAHPNETITHNVTITAHTDLALQSFTLFIYAPVNSSLQEIKNRTISWDFLENETLTSRIEFQLPQNTNGTLNCVITFQTDQSADYSSYTFYTTDVREKTYSELLSAYNTLLVDHETLQNLYDQTFANYSNLLGDFETLNASYNVLFAEYYTLNKTYNQLVVEYGALNSSYNSLLVNYDTLNSTYTLLSVEYGILNSTYNALAATYNTLNANYNALVGRNNELQSDYDSLSSSHSRLQTNYDSLETNYNVLLGKNNVLQLDYDSLNSTYFSAQGIYNSLRVAYGSLNNTKTELENEIRSLSQRISASEDALNSDRIIMFIFTMVVAGLVAFIIYIKRKKPEPYMVIRKETVAVNSEEKS